MKVRDIMNINTIRIMSDATMADAADLAANSNASGIFVVDEENNFIGVLSEGDMMAKMLPNITEIMSSGSGVKDFQDIFKSKGTKLGRERVADHLVATPITLSPDDNMLKVATTMSLKKMRRLPVVKDGKLIATISRGDICKAALKE
jgi:CBS domain-containing protein